MNLIILGAAALVVFIVLDLIWFSLAGDFFKKEIGSIARLTSVGDWNVLYLPALLAYALMSVGIVAFVYLNAASLTNAFLLGALFGLISYGLYDMTNLATLSAWTWRFALVDMFWGAFLCGAVGTMVYYIGKNWL